MLIALVISQALSWVLISGLAFTCLALARQVGVLYERVAPVGVLSGGLGPTAGQASPVLQLTSLTGGNVAIGGAATQRRLVLFVGPKCPICKKLIPLARRVARAEDLELQLASDADEAELLAMIRREGLEDLPMVNSRDLGLAYAVDKLPHAVLLSKDGTIIARGLANTREHLESLIVADELGVGSVQDFVRTRTDARQVV